MDSPEPVQTTNITAATAAAANLSDSPPVQESPFTNYASNLSPIKPVKAAHPVQGFTGVGSPPLVFTSPRIISHRETSFLQRSQLSQISSAEIPDNDDDNKKAVNHSDDLGESVTYCSSRLITGTQKDNNVENSPQEQPCSSSECVEEYLYDPIDVDCNNSENLVNPSVKQSKDVLQSSALSEQVEENSQGKSTLEIKAVQVEEEQSCSKQPSIKCPNIETDLPMDHAPEQYDDSAMQIVQAHEGYSENVGTTLQGDIQNTSQCDPEVSQLQRGLSRRCLQFEEAQQKTTVNSTSSPHLMTNVTSSGSPASATDLENLDSCQVDLIDSSKKKQMVNLSCPVTSMFPLRNSGKSPVIVSKPSGIGLHLNSIVNALPVGHSATSSIKSTPIVSCHQVDHESGCSTLIASEDRMLETKASQVEPSNMLQPLEHQVTPLKKRKFSAEHADNFEEFSQSSPTKNKRKKSSSIDGDGCKRCNCKKTKCLKLYCDCFAAGIYCAEPCSCQGCFNRPEYEDTVLQTRQQIESRNPLAFAPKIVQHVTEFAAVSREVGNRLTPSLPRHKRGCNCKRSMCLKKYCECYQANVGCSSECRCEGCKNVYGRKEEYGMTEEIVSNRISEGRLDGRVDDKLGMVATNKDLLHAELHDMHNLTPSTPSFQHSDHGKDAVKSQLNSSRYVPSPESDFSVLPSYAKSIRSPRNSHSNNMIPERSKEIVDVNSYGQEMDYNIAEMMDQFSPRCNTLADICELTPLGNPSMTLASSASSKTRDWASGSRLQLCPGSGRFSSGRSLRWRSSPITPMTRLGENKNQGNDSDSGLYGILEDDTPEILKEASTPIVSVKASSPNKKRVSPPHSHIHDLRSSSSGGLRSGRKFILKAVPSFPPLTPCIDSKGSTNEKQ